MGCQDTSRAEKAEAGWRSEVRLREYLERRVRYWRNVALASVNALSDVELPKDVQDAIADSSETEADRGGFR